MKTIMLKLQIILTVIIMVGIYLFMTKDTRTAQYDMSALYPMAQSVAVESNDTFDILKENLDATKRQTPEAIAEQLFDQAMKSPSASHKNKSAMMERAKIQAQKMIETGNVTPYREEVDKNLIMKKIISE